MSPLALKPGEGKLIPVNNSGCVTATWDRRSVLIKGKETLTKKELWLRGLQRVCKMPSCCCVGVRENCKRHVAKSHVELLLFSRHCIRSWVAGGVMNETVLLTRG